MIDIQAPAFQKNKQLHVGSDPLQVHVVDHALQLVRSLEEWEASPEISLDRWWPEIPGEIFIPNVPRGEDVAWFQPPPPTCW